MAVALTILTRRIPDPQESLGFSAQMRVAGGIAPYSWQVVAGFGSLPPGMSLSAAGVLSALPLAIPPTAVGTYTFRIEVTDSLPTTVFLDYTIKVLPSGYDTVPDWLVDPVLRSLASRLADDPIDREKAEIHFFRGIIGVMGEYYAHFDEDIYCPDWRVPGNNVNLRDALEAVYLVAFGSIRTINTIPPDGTSDFKIQAGTGITLTPIANGLEVSSASAVALDQYEWEGDLPSFTEQTLAIPSRPSLVTAWARTRWTSGAGPSYDEWHNVSTPSEECSKYVDDWAMGVPYSTLAVGDGIHLVYYDGSGAFNFVKYDSNTVMELLRAFVIIPLGFYVNSEPLLMVGPTCMVFACSLGGTLGPPGGVLYAEIDTTTYAVNFQTVIMPTAPATDFQPNEASTYTPHQRIFGSIAMDVTMTFWVASIATKVLDAVTFPAAPIQPILLDVVIGSGGLLSYQVPVFGGLLPLNAETLDLSPVSNPAPSAKLFWTIATNRVFFAPFPFGGTLDLYWTTPGLNGPVGAYPPPPGVLATVNVDMSQSGAQFDQAMFCFDRARGVGVLGYIFEVWNGPPGSEDLAKLYFFKGKQFNGIPGAPVSATSLQPDVPILNIFGGRFAREYIGFNDSIIHWCDTQFSSDRIIIRKSTITPWGIKSQLDEIYSAATSNPQSAYDSFLRVAHASPYHVDGQMPVLLPTLTGWKAPLLDLDTPNKFHVYYDDVTKNLIIENNTRFTWYLRVSAAVLQSAYQSPPNLLISCYQFSEAMKRYHDAATWFPSPSTIPGVQVNWTEAQVATTNVGGFQFDSYYSVTPGAYDLYSGSVAQGRYFADEAAGMAQDYTFVFRYNYYPSLITAAEADIKAALDNFLALTPPLPHGTGVNPNYYTLPEVDAILGTTFATTYSGPPYDYYRYFLFTNTDGLSYEHGYFSQNYVDTGVAYGPHPASGLSIPVQESFTVAVPGAGNVSDFFTLSTSVTAARVYVNGIMYLEGIDWVFSGMNVIEYFNRQPGGFVLTVGSVVTVDKWNL